MMQALRTLFRPGEFTGYHMLATMVAFFGVIIVVNIVMARFAVTTWTGLVVENTYVASQQFNDKAAKAKAIAALAYHAELGSSPAGLFVLLTDRAGAPASSDVVEVTLHHPVGALGDRSLTLAPQGQGRFATSEVMPEGAWIAAVEARDGDSVVYQKAHRLHVKADGTLRK